MAAAAVYRGKLSRVVAFALRIGRLPAAALARRRLLSQLGALDERMLRDIGLTRNDVVSASAEPLFRDPTLVLAQRVQDRRQSVRATAREQRALAQLMLDWTESDRAA